MTTFSLHKPLSCKPKTQEPFSHNNWCHPDTQFTNVKKKPEFETKIHLFSNTQELPNSPTLWINILFKFFSKKFMCWPIWGFQLDPCSDLVFKIIYNGFKWNKFHHNTYPRSRPQDPNWTQHGKNQGQLNLSL
jgi:hypothetical protein